MPAIPLDRTTRLSYAIMAGLFILMVWLHLAVLLLTGLFGYLALSRLGLGGRKPLGVALYIILVLAIGYGFFAFGRQAYVTLPKIAETTIPAVTDWAEEKGIPLPFTDIDSLRKVAINTVSEGIGNVGRYLRAATFEMVTLIVGLVAAVSLYLDPRWNLGNPASDRENLYGRTSQEVSLRFRSFYQSFVTVMGAQLLISAINTTLTAVYLVANGFPFVTMLVALTFLCGLVPIVGNLVSNTLIMGVGFTISPRVALLSLVYLVVIHKLEYFLNSKIIGDRIKNPMWLTLIGLVIGEKLMGIPGMILAPVVLHYLKTETSTRRA
ncbi:MAG: AI-2E family transporter [Verrucomicrobiales bacterium]|nr:AI-2E family transporter [Verrucomicrobiales bacterium]MCP5528254.1 AI-2E family transporter [Verrucomicrobiales bacterium]